MPGQEVLIEEQYDSKPDTMKHIQKVNDFAMEVLWAFVRQVSRHDQSKLESPEKEAFDRMKALSDVEYGSDEYKRILDENRPAIKHHHEHNRHHPEYHEAGTYDMTLIDIFEMLCDWKASTLRSKNGDIRRSIKIQAEKHEISDELMSILENTVDMLEW